MVEKQKLTLGSVTDVGKNTLSGVSANDKLTSTSVITSSRISAHSIKWIWEYEGKTNRRPDRRARMRGWNKDIYYWGGATIVLNPKRMEVYMRSRPYKDTEKMIYYNWDRADVIAREFSRHAQIAIRPIPSEHPADVHKAHLVVNKKDINAHLLPMVGKGTPHASAIRVGALEDGSHRRKVEFTGPESVEGGFGLDWLLLEYPTVVRQSLDMNARFSKNLELHLKVLKDMRKTLKEIRKKKGD
jgi:hypothetical protein